MDTRTQPAAKIDQKFIEFYLGVGAKASWENQQLAEVKAFMPETYKSIKTKAEAIGNDAFVLVRRGLRGEANMFYAFEGGRVVGTPFSLVEITRDIAGYMVTFGCTHVCIWAESTVHQAKEGGVGHGAH